MGKVDFHKTRKAWEIKHFKFIVFLNISGEAEIHTIPEILEKGIFLVRKKYGKTQRFSIFFAISQI